MTDHLWHAKLAAWLHDPAEKALILLRDKTGHEWGTVAALREEIFGSREISAARRSLLKRADWYAAAADRPQWPMSEVDGRYAAWTQVDFAVRPVLVHPLSGASHQLPSLTDIDADHLKSVSLEHFSRLIVRGDDGAVDLKRTLLAFWRFGPDAPAPDLRHLWRNLPADTRVPDHSIWAHLDIVSAFAGAMISDATATPALLAVSFGPVQSFIAEARTTSDLWAGSHLLARIAWEGMKVVCEAFGPDALLFPQLRGVPFADGWLRDEVVLPSAWFDGAEWARLTSDANPLFSAALPNRFVAMVPHDRATDLAGQIKDRVRGFVQDLGDQTLRLLLQELGEPWRGDLPCVEQMAQQLAGFPEVHWATVPWSLAEGESADGRRPADAAALRAALSPFYPPDVSVGFVEGDTWKVLSQGVELDGARFYDPNPGTLYPALYDLLDRVAAAAKATRPFEPLPQEGYRSTLNGEREWLTLDRTELWLPPGKRESTLWARLAAKRPNLARKGEHLDALAAIKRLWPTLFTAEVGGIVGADVRRYVVSTHTLALAVSLEKWLDSRPRAAIPPRLDNLLQSVDAERTALPYRIVRKLDSEEARLLCRKLPGVLDVLKEKVASDARTVADRRELAQAEEMLRTAEAEVKNLFGTKPETYYGLILLDGDRMGAWLSGGASSQPPTYRECWHPQIRAGIAERFPGHQAIEKYLATRRPPSPARHRIISEALNHFSLKVARFVVEECFKGKLIYAGGDDVLAFVCVDDLLPAMALLRHLYSGLTLPGWLATRLNATVSRSLDSAEGWLLLKDELLLTMGPRAQASAGAVVAHHQAPLGFVLQQLRQAESQAKHAGGRDAFCLRIIKRAGGEVGVTDKWFREDGSSAPELLARLVTMLGAGGVSRRAMYNSVEWLQQLPRQTDASLLSANLAHQFERQGGDRRLALDLAAYCSSHHTGDPVDVVCRMLMTAEFLARESRQGANEAAAHSEVVA